MKILAIETSCDETAVAVIEVTGNVENASFTVLGQSLFSQAHLHNEYGGVYPNLAKREHQKNLIPLIQKTLSEAGLLNTLQQSHTFPESVFEKVKEEYFRNDIKKFLSETENPSIDLIAVTNGPGLEPALWTGVALAEAFSVAWNIPVVGINHMEGHIISALLQSEESTKYKIQSTKLPLLALLISGGHSELVLMKQWFEYELIGKTRDDAVGEAYDKVARIMNLPYPGGPEIDQRAGRAQTRENNPITFPRPMIQEDSCDFSFSGLKTAVLYKTKEMGTLTEGDKENIADAFQSAVRDVLVAKTKRALSQTETQTLVVGGGVSANSAIKKGLEGMVEEFFPHTTLYFPERGLTGDNAVMIGIAAGLRALVGATNKESLPLHVNGSQSLSEI